MKAVLTLEFDKLADLREAVQRLTTPTEQRVERVVANKPYLPHENVTLNTTAPAQGAAPLPELTATNGTAGGAPDAVATTPPAASSQQASTAETPPKPPRKPRADAGKPRGPHKSTTTGEPAASEAVRAANSDAETAAAPATPTNSAAPQQTGHSAVSAGENIAAPAAAAADPSKLTIDDVRAAIARISGTKGLGMQGCMDILKEFSVLRVTDLKQEQYAKFIASANDKVAKAGA